MLLRFWLMMLLVGSTFTALAQEPAFFSNGSAMGQAVRYEQAHGVYHYVVPCKQLIGGMSYDTEVALCWPVNAMRLRMGDGKLDFSAATQGTLTISAREVRFIPVQAKDMALYFSVPIFQAQFSDQSGSGTSGFGTAMIGSKEVAYKFGFANVCVPSCAPGSVALDPSKNDQLKAEFRNVADSLKTFDSVYGRFRTMALQVRFIVTPGNQPKPGDVVLAMELYGGLNGRLAEVCSESARSCIKKYQAYQECSGKNPSSGTCGAPPDCTATCTLAPESYKRLEAGVCESPSRDSATLFPRWTEYARTDESGRGSNPSATAAPPSPVVAGMAGVPGAMGGVLGSHSTTTGTSWTPPPGWGSLAGMSGGTFAMVDVASRQPPDDSCSASHVYARMKAMHATTH